MLKRILVFSLLSVGFLFISCSSDDDKNQLSTSKEITAFRLEVENNENLTETITGEINGETIQLEIPKYTDLSELIATFEYKGNQVLIGSIPQESGVTPNDFSTDIRYTVEAEDGSTKEYTISIDKVQPEAVLPHIYVELDDPDAGPELGGSDKRVKFAGDMMIDGMGVYDDFEGRIDLRGRGNSTWGMPKKPYKIYLEEKAPLFGLAPYKKWILLNEYLEGSMLYNSIPFKTGELLGMPYTHNVIPVQVSINGEFRGVYAFMEHKEVGEGRIDIGDDGLLLELDTHFDEQWKFRSKNYKLPVMLQHPKEKHITQSVFDEIKNDFTEFEELVYTSSFPDNDYLDYFDDLSFVHYMIVYTLTDNEEINHPKSTYINRPAGEKYHMGILWDFDYGFGYEANRTHFELSTAQRPLFWEDDKPGTRFFSKLMEDPHMQSLFKERWEWFVNNKYDELKEYVRDYAANIKIGYAKDHKLWGKRTSTGDPDQDLNKVLNWLEARVEYINNYTTDF